jgi:hypothetical protein
MAELQRFPLTTTTGERGYILRRARFLDSSEQSRVVLEDGTELMAPSDDIEPQNDGSFLLHSRPNREPALPPVDDFSTTRIESVSTEARTEPISRTDDVPTSRQADIPPAPVPTDTLYADDVAIDRVPVNRIFDEAPTTRQEGDVTVIPVVEEVLVVQKRYMVKEEIRIDRRRQVVQEPRRILLDDSMPHRS